MPFRVPPILLFALVIVIAAIIVPGIRSHGFRVTPMKAAALAIAIGLGIYSRSWPIGIVLLGPLSLVWFPEAWGSYTGFFQGQYINEKTPPVLVTFMGWLLLFVLFFLVAWFRWHW